MTQGNYGAFTMELRPGHWASRRMSPGSPSPRPRCHSPNPGLVEIQRLLDCYTNANYHMFYTLIYATGLRITEASLLETCDIDAIQVIHVLTARPARTDRCPGTASSTDYSRPTTSRSSRRSPGCSPPSRETHHLGDRPAGPCCAPLPSWASARWWILICCVTPLPSTCWRMAPICERYRLPWTTAASSPTRSTPG